MAWLIVAVVAEIVQKNKYEREEQGYRGPRRLDLKSELDAQRTEMEQAVRGLLDWASTQRGKLNNAKQDGLGNCHTGRWDRGAVSDDQGKIDSGALINNGQSHFCCSARLLGWMLSNGVVRRVVGC